MKALSVPAAPATFRAPPLLMRNLSITAGLGLLCFLVGLFVDPVRAWGGYLMGFFLFTGTALAGPLFLTVLTLSGARWGVVLRRVPEALAATLPWAAGMGLLLLGGLSSLYEWSRPSALEHDPILQGKSAYLNGGFFFARMLLFFGLWIWLSRGMLRASREQDQDGHPAHRRRLLMRAVCFLPIFALTWSLASLDWVQSLEPLWFSTIYALGTLSGLGCSGLAVCILLVIFLRRRGDWKGAVREDHLDDLGKIALGFSLFWGYIWYCQYMLIWYTNMPEETPYYALRMRGEWRLLTWVSLALNWAVPFFVLMPKAARRSEVVLARIAGLMLLGQVVNGYLLVCPALMGESLRIGFWDLGPVVGALAFFFWASLRALERADLVPLRDPELAASLAHHC